MDPVFTHAASPFLRTEVPTPVAFASPPPPAAPPGPAPWVTYKTPIQFGFATLAYLMFLVGALTVVQSNSSAAWRYLVAILPMVPAGIVIWLFVRALNRVDEVQKRVQVQAFGFALASTALITFGYGFLEGAGMPELNSALVLPLMILMWAAGMGWLAVRYRLRR